MRNLRSFGGVLVAAFLLSACSTSHQKLPQKSASASPTRLVPQPDGTPLPPRNPHVADGWPPEFKQLIDNMSTLFPQTLDAPAPNVDEVQRRMGITLTERPLNGAERTYLSRRYEISGTRYADAATWEVFRAFYSISKDYNSRGERFQILRLEIGPKQSGFCLSPYELAVYAGWHFTNADTTPHVDVRSWPPAYVWGMFEWSNAGRYGGPGYNIDVGIVKDGTGKIVGADCVQSITVNGRYPK